MENQRGEVRTYSVRGVIRDVGGKRSHWHGNRSVIRQRTVQPWLASRQSGNNAAVTEA
jgi:hypothetical protein